MGESARVAVGSGVTVKGIGVCVAGGVAVEEGKGAGVGVAGWQAVMRMKHPIRSFFMALIKTQFSGGLFQTIKFKGAITPQSIAAYTPQAINLFHQQATPREYDQQ